MAVAAVIVPDMPVIVIAVVLEGAVPETPIDSVEVTVPPAGGVTGLGLNPPVTPAGKVADNVTGEAKAPDERSVMRTLPVPPWPTTRLLGLAERLNSGVAVTVKVALADLPVLPVTWTA